MMKKISILGGGISGMSAAVVLAKAGFNVTIHEKNKDAGMRFHGDLQGIENWTEKSDVLDELRGYGLALNFDCDPFNSYSLTNIEKSVEFKTSKPLFYLVKRGNVAGSLDLGLKAQAKEAGVKLSYGSTIKEEDADIVATGSYFKEAPGVVKGIVFKTKHKDIISLILNDEYAYNGYSYLLITKGYGCMCSVAINELSRVTKCFEKSRKYFEANYTLGIKDEHQVGGVGSFRMIPTPMIDERLYVGEAAGLQDFLAGFGIRYALISGCIAAQSILKQDSYEKIIRRRFGPKLKASVVNRYLFESAGKNNYSFVIEHPNLVTSFLYSFHNFNILQRIMLPFILPGMKKKYPFLKF